MRHFEYRGITITDHNPTRLHCSFTVDFPGFGSIGALNEAEAKQKVDNWIANRERKLEKGEVRIVAVMPGTRAAKASTCRNRSEQARGQRRREDGRFGV